MHTPSVALLLLSKALKAVTAMGEGVVGRGGVFFRAIIVNKNPRPDYVMKSKWSGAHWRRKQFENRAQIWVNILDWEIMFGPQAPPTLFFVLLLFLLLSYFPFPKDLVSQPIVMKLFTHINDNDNIVHRCRSSVNFRGGTTFLREKYV